MYLASVPSYCLPIYVMFVFFYIDRRQPFTQLGIADVGFYRLYVLTDAIPQVSEYWRLLTI